MGWGGLQLATKQCDSEVLKGLPDWTRSTSSHTHTHTRFDGLSKHTSAVQTNERVGWGVGWGGGGGGWGGLQLATRQCRLVVAMASNLLALTRVPKRYRSRVPKRTIFCVPKRLPRPTERPWSVLDQVSNMSTNNRTSFSIPTGFALSNSQSPSSLSLDHTCTWKKKGAATIKEKKYIYVIYRPN